MTLTIDEGRSAVELARSTLDSFVRTGEFRRGSWKSGPLSEKRGVFVTLNLAGEGNEVLRGCIGYTEPIKPLGEAIQDVTVFAASEDPRFSPVRQDELDGLVVEVSVLTVPEVLEVRRRQELPSHVRVGKDGLIVSNSFTSGLLLPQVAVENDWEAEDFLSQTCMKAGLTPDAWLDDDTRVQRFQAEVFSEQAPRGVVVRRPL